MNEAQAYEKHKNLKLAAAELGIKWQTLYVRLRKAGISVTGDKLRYGSETDRLAAMTEHEFMRLVPKAESRNAKEWQAKVDFYVSGLGVDVKASRIGKANRWNFCVKKQEFTADFLVCFAYEGTSYRVLLVPGEIARRYQTLHVRRAFTGKWADYEIDPQDIASFFDDLIQQ